MNHLIYSSNDCIQIPFFTRSFLTKVYSFQIYVKFFFKKKKLFSMSIFLNEIKSNTLGYKNIFNYFKDFKIFTRDQPNFTTVRAGRP